MEEGTGDGREGQGPDRVELEKEKEKELGNPKFTTGLRPLIN